MPNFSGVWDLKDQVQAIAAGRWTGVSLSALYGWGSGATGRLGDETITNKSSPVQVGSAITWQQVSAGDNHTVALASDNTLWSWGSNSSGSLGDGTTFSRSSPVQIGSLTNWSQVSAGDDHSAALKSDGTLWTWGKNTYGKLGNSSTADLSSPIQVGALTNWAQVVAGSVNTDAIKTDGTLWAWGGSNFGRLGNDTGGTTNNRSSPIQIGALTNWAQVARGGAGAAAVKTDGTIWAWGRNTFGNVGDGTTIDRSSPVQIGALTNWAQVSTQSATGAIKTDGTLWTWGYSGSGVLGTNVGAGNNASSPVQVGALTTWSKVSVGNHMLALKDDGTLWAWGTNSSGQLGNNTVVARSSPVQIGNLTSWTDVSAGSIHGFAILQGTVS